MMIDTTFNSCTQEKREGSKITGGEAQENKMQTKTRNKSRKVYSDGKEIFFT